VTLSTGTLLGSYLIEARLGAGGMGEVYRARDTKLNRAVALKILPNLFADDPDRLTRFAREAQMLASLNHANIAQIYGVEEGDAESGRTLSALVMELVEGEDLAERIERGPIPQDEALPIARQIAEALEAAHETGIIHRDLKPANIKVRSDGAVKVLDFGLAKALSPGSSPSIDPMHSPTLTARATDLGMILGTAAYMAPEQARGKAVDRRADIWAFGCVLYEMLSGQRAFGSDDVTGTLTAVLRDPPAWKSLPASTPAAVRSLLARCLDKDPKQRLRDIGEARVALTDGGATAAAAAPLAAGTAVPPRAGRWLMWGAVGLLVAFAGVIGALLVTYPRPGPEQRVQKSYVALQSDGSPVRFPVMSPDGKRIVYASRSRLWVQELDAWDPRELAGTEGGVRPFWSPGGDWIAFFRSERLLKVPAAGGPVVSITTLPAVQAPLNAGSAVWTRDGTILLSLASGPLTYRVASGGGDLKEFVRIPEEIGADLHDLSALPDGSLVTAVHRTNGIDALGVLSAGKLTIVLEATDVAAPHYTPSGHLVFARRSPNAGLWAVPYSAKDRQVTGEPFLIGRGTDPTVARDGTLLFIGEPEALARQLAWFTMDGRLGATIAEPQDWIEGVALSPDGRRLVASASDGLWAYDLSSGARSRLTTARTDITPQWIGTTGQLTFVRSASSGPELMIKRAVAGGEERRIAENARFPTVTENGRRLVFNIRKPGETAWDVAWLDVQKPSEIHTLGGAHLGARFPAVSPDGRLVAYISGEIGRDEVFLTRFPSGDGKWQVSREGGGWCRFDAKGRSVVYRAPNGDLMSVPIALDRDVAVGRPQRLFEWGSGWLPFYELASDGVRGVAAVPVGKDANVASLSLVQNWHLEFAGSR